MKILYLHQYFTTPQYSGGTRSYEFARRLAARGHEVTLLTTSAYLDPSWAPRPGWNVHDVEGVRVEVVGSAYSNRMGFARRLGQFGDFARRAALRGMSLPCDVVFATSTPLTIALPGMAVAGRRRVPLVFEVRDLWPEVPIAIGALKNPIMIRAARVLEDAAYGRSSAIIALSPDMKAGVQERGIAETKVSVIPNLSRPDLFSGREADGEAFRREHAWLGDRPLVLYAGTFGIINQVESMVAMARAAADFDPDIRFLAVGDGIRREAVEDAARQAGVLGTTFHILPPQPKSDIAALIATAQISISLVAPIRELWANSANKVFDAFAAGTTVGVNHGGWLADLLRESGAGHVLPHDDDAAAGRKLVQIVRDQRALADSERAARQLAATMFDSEVAADALERILQNAVSM